MLQILNHGDIHLGYVNQFRVGTSPAENIFIAGYPANYYWLYHAFVAAVSRIVDFHPASVASAINIVMLFSALMWIGKTVVAVNLIGHRTFMLGMLAVFVLFSVNIMGVAHGGPELLDEPFNLERLRMLLIEGADRRLHSVLPKYFGFGSTSIGFMLFAAALYACVKLIQNHFEFHYLYIISAAGIGTLAVQQFAAIFIVGVLIGTAILILFFSLFINRDKRSVDFGKLISILKHPVNILSLLVWLGISLGLSVPLIQYNLDISYNYEIRTLLGLPNLDNLYMITGALYILLPFYILHLLYVAFVPRVEQVYIAIATTLAILLTLGLSFADANQYKGVYLLAILMAISTLMLLSAMQQHENLLVRVVGRLLVLILVLLSFSNVLYSSYWQYNQTQEQPYQGFVYARRIVGLNFSYEGDKRIRAYYWMRINAPGNAVVITPNNVLRFTHIIHERLTYVRPAQFDFASNIVDYPIRLDLVNRFYSGEAAPEELKSIYNQFVGSLPDRPIYAVVKDKEVDQEIMEQLGAVQVYAHEDGDGAHLYHLNPG